jgi:hypothetical protein
VQQHLFCNGMTWARDVVCVGAWFVFVSELGRGAGWLTESTSDMGKKGLERPGIIGDRKKHTEKKKKKKKKKKEKKKKKRRSAASLMPTPRPALLRGDAIPKPMITPQTAHHHRHHHHHHNHPILCLAPLFPQIIFLDFNSKTATTTPATTAASVSQNAQHIQARWRCFFFWLASHESLDGASAVMVVQKRNWLPGRPASALNDSADALTCRVKPLMRRETRSACRCLLRGCRGDEGCDADV